MARRTREEAERTRETLLEAAEQVFLERGVARATLEDVARKAGFSRGAVHWHFQDKLGLFNALAERAWLTEEQIARDIMASREDDPLGGLCRVVTEALTLTEADPRRRRLLLMLRLDYDTSEDLNPALERLRSARSLLKGAVRDAFEEAERRGQLAPGWSTSLVTLTFHALLSGLVEMWLRNEDEDFSLSRDGCAMVRAFLRTVDATASPPPPA
ncbi:TetR family transcriptional regulator [Geminicoccaceae bacterium 1502E]|nr:TetR family transcriptional regulator [Geminicoccaceae bacterium 1502E]